MKQFHLRVSETFANQLTKLKELTDAPSLSSVVRDSICLYTWVLQHLGEGRQIVVIDANTEGEKEYEIDTPGLQAMKAKKTGIRC